MPTTHPNPGATARRLRRSSANAQRGATARGTPRSSASAHKPPTLTLRAGTPTDYDHLALYHYHPTRPATIVHSLALAARNTDEPVAILTVSMPTLNGAWRALAWPDLADPRLSPRERAQRINTTLRTISRVIVDPRFRARGLATALVRAYLAQPLTPRTEAVAAMADPCRFFARAGMRPLRAPTPARDLRLARILNELRIVPWTLIDPARSRDLVTHTPALTHALRRWANDSRATRNLLRADPAQLAARAARALLSTRTVYIASTETPTCQSPSSTAPKAHPPRPTPSTASSANT